jgi:outer membrane receptor protein involved in Fe transport
VCGALLMASPTLAQDLPSLELPGGPPGPKAPAGAGVELPEAIDVSDMVLAAAKQPISVQESPSIITVVTREQMLQRGYRTMWDVLETIPGFESNRYLFTYRYTDVATRGNFNTVLILWNGISIVDPKDGIVVLDRRLPLDAIDRVEVTSGPGGVLWGANAYLGVVNIITRDAGSFRGIEASASYGTGPGEEHAFKASATAAERFFKGKLRMMLNLTFYTSEWADIRIPADGLLPPFNSPSPDGAFAYRPSTVPVNTPRNYHFTATGNIGLGPVQLDWHLPWSRQYHPLPNHQIRTEYPVLWDPNANGGLGAALPAPTTCSFDPTSLPCRSMKVYPLAWGADFHLVSARYQDQFWQNKIGLTARGYWVGFLNIHSRQAFIPPSIWKAPYIGDDFLRGSKPWPDNELAMKYFTDQYRAGGSVDVTAQLPFRNRAIVGAEFFVEGVNAKYQKECNGDTAMTCEALNQSSANAYPQADGTTRYAHDLIEYPGRRMVAAAFVNDEWRPFQRLALSAGVRYQHLSLDVDTTAPGRLWADTGKGVDGTFGTKHTKNSQDVVIGAAAGTFNVWKKTHVKVNFTQGFRPPRLFDLIAPVAGSPSSYPGNPRLDVENSYAIEGEANTLLLERYKGIRKLYLRADYSYSRISNLIIRPQLIAINAGERTANSVEFAMFLEGMKGWNVWLNYYFLDLVDAQTGPVRNIARQKVNVGGALKLLGGKLELSTVLSLIGPRDDLNREFLTDAAHATLSFPGAYVTTPAMLRIDHMGWLPLWRVGAWVRNVVPKVDFSLFVDNLLDVRYAIPDSDWQARQALMPTPMPGLTFMLSAWVKI